jgi:hypothetical protein
MIWLQMTGNPSEATASKPAPAEEQVAPLVALKAIAAAPARRRIPLRG